MAITDEAFWEMERRFWTSPIDESENDIAPECVMVLAHAGILDRDFAIAGMRAAPRWADVTFSEQRVARSGKTLAVLAYRANARRNGAQPYDAYCSSTYRGTDTGWKLVQHQQTKAD